MSKNYGYKVDINSTLTYSEYSTEPYGPWSEEWENILDQIITRDNKYPNLVSKIKFIPGEPLYVVWAEWSAGDSFGWATSKYSEPYALFRNKKSAEDFKKHLKTSKGDITFEVEGQHIELFSLPWLGYFEELNSINIDTCIIGA